MSQTTPPTVEALPTAPNTNAPTVFSSLMDAFLAALLVFRTQLVALGTNVYNNAVDCYNNATAASSSASAAAASAAAAVATSGVAIWVSGTTYAVGDCRFSPTTFYTYRRTTVGAGTTDPASDTTNWVSVINSQLPYLKVSDQKASGSSAATSVAADITQTRVLNTVETNTIVGASLSANTVTLPAGTYQFRGRAPAYGAAAGHKLFLYNSSDSTYPVNGSNASTWSGATVGTDSFASGQFTIASAKNFTLRHYTATAVAQGLGQAVSSGRVEVYAEAEFWKVA